MKKQFIASFCLLLATLPAGTGFAQHSEDATASDAAVDTTLVATMAQGAMIRMYDWISVHLEYPQWAYERMVEITIPVTFDVESDGTISNPRCEDDTRGLPVPLLLMIEEAVRTVASVSEWTGPSEPHSYTIPVEFAMPDFDPARKPVFLWETENVTEDELYQFRDRMIRWLRSRIDIPEDFKISLSFIVEKFGSVSNVKIISTSDAEVAARVKADLENSPKWIPGYNKKGEPVRAFQYARLSFEAEVADPEETDEKTEVMPLFKGGGLENFRAWVMSRLVYPPYAVNELIQGRVILSFMVEKDGRVTFEEVVHSPNELLTQTAVEVVKRSPKWTPGYRNGEPRRYYYILPVDFKLE